MAAAAAAAMVAAAAAIECIWQTKTPGMNGDPMATTVAVVAADISRRLQRQRQQRGRWRR